jgi:acetylornithine deacetylase/succinyl-diaminopimelate desuccinylase-like protein
MSMDKVLHEVDQTLDAAVARLTDLLRIPSISTDPAFSADCDRAADWLVRELQGLGFEASKRKTPGHPMVVGHGDGSGPHLLFYGHYDVQPVDPLELWTNGGPFEPQVIGTNGTQAIHGRGSATTRAS